MTHRNSIIFIVFNTFLMSLVVIATLYPMIYMFSISFSSNSAVMRNQVIFFPVDFSTTAYRQVIGHVHFWQGYLNTVIYTVTGTALSLFMTILCAYPLSKRNLLGRKFLLKFMVFTMYFSGGLVPHYLLIVNLGMIDTIWAIIVPGAISVFLMLVMRTFFMGIPASLEEAAMVDGYGHFQILLKIILPLSKPVLATITLFTSVFYWNEWFMALIYLRSWNRMPVTLFLRNLLMGGRIEGGTGNDWTEVAINQTMQAAAVILIITPIILVYPFVQRYFVQGVMIGSIKE